MRFPKPRGEPAARRPDRRRRRELVAACSREPDRAARRATGFCSSAVAPSRSASSCADAPARPSGASPPRRSARSSAPPLGSGRRAAAPSRPQRVGLRRSYASAAPPCPSPISPISSPPAPAAPGRFAMIRILRSNSRTCVELLAHLAASSASTAAIFGRLRLGLRRSASRARDARGAACTQSTSPTDAISDRPDAAPRDAAVQRRVVRIVEAADRPPSGP